MEGTITRQSMNPIVIPTRAQVGNCVTKCLSQLSRLTKLNLFLCPWTIEFKKYFCFQNWHQCKQFLPHEWKKSNDWGYNILGNSQVRSRKYQRFKVSGGYYLRTLLILPDFASWIGWIKNGSINYMDLRQTMPVRCYLYSFWKRFYRSRSWWYWYIRIISMYNR